MKRLYVALFILVLTLSGCTDNNDSSFIENHSKASDVNIDINDSISGNQRLEETSSVSEEIFLENSTTGKPDEDSKNSTNEGNSTNAESSVGERKEESIDDSSKIPDPPEGTIVYDFPGEEVYYREGYIFDYERGKAEFEKYYKLVDDYWEELPMIEYEQTISVPHLRSEELTLSLWMVLDGDKLIRAKDRNGAPWKLKPHDGKSWLFDVWDYYYLLWDEETQQFVDVFKDIELSMDEGGYALCDIAEDMSSALFRGKHTDTEYVAKIYADLVTNTTYDLEELAGEEIQVGLLTKNGAICVSGLYEQDPYRKPGLYTTEYDETSVRKITIDGHEFLFWHLGGKGRVQFQREDRLNYYTQLYTFVVQIGDYKNSQAIDLSIIPENSN